MKISVIGAGAIGGNLATRLAEAGHNVTVSDARGAGAVPSAAVTAGAHPAELDDAVSDHEVIIVSVPFSRQVELAGLLARTATTAIVVDTSNYYPELTGRLEEIDAGEVESVWVEQRLGRPVVKAWNAALAATQQTKGRPSGSASRLAIPVAADSAESRATVMRLVDDTGFDPVDAGTLAESWRQQPGTPGYCTELEADQLRLALLTAHKEAAPAIRDALWARFAALTSAPDHEETVAANRAPHQ